MSDGDNKARDDKARDVIDQLRSLSMRAAADFLQIVHRVNGARDEADGTIFSGGENSTASTEPRPQAGELIYDFVKLQLEAADRLLQLSQKSTDLWVDRLKRSGASLVPPEKRLTRLRSKVTAKEPPRWEVYVFNAAHRARRIKLRTRNDWQDDAGNEVAECRAQIESPEIPARCERQLQITHPMLDAFGARGCHVAEVEMVLDRQVVGVLELTLERS